MADKLKDIDHTPPFGDGANTVWERGNEHDGESNSTGSQTDAESAALAADD